MPGLEIQKCQLSHTFRCSIGLSQGLVGFDKLEERVFASVYCLEMVVVQDRHLIPRNYLSDLFSKVCVSGCCSERLSRVAFMVMKRTSLDVGVGLPIKHERYAPVLQTCGMSRKNQEVDSNLRSRKRPPSLVFASSLASSRFPLHKVGASAGDQQTITVQEVGVPSCAGGSKGRSTFLDPL